LFTPDRFGAVAKVGVSWAVLFRHTEDCLLSYGIDSTVFVSPYKCRASNAIHFGSMCIHETMKQSNQA
jgi:hypothetical protein